MLLLFWSSGVINTGTDYVSIRLSLLAVANPFATASPSITLALAPSTSAQFGSQAAPSIRLSLSAYAIGGHTVAGNTVLLLEYNA